MQGKALQLASCDGDVSACCVPFDVDAVFDSSGSWLFGGVVPEVDAVAGW